MWLIKTDDGSKSTLCKKKEMMKLKIYLKRFESDHGGNMAEWCYLKMEEFFCYLGLNGNLTLLESCINNKYGNLAQYA